MKYTGVFTTYTSGGRPYGSYILAQSTDEAAVIARQRNIGETILSNPLAIEPMPDFRGLEDGDFIRHLGEIMHQAAFLTYIALSSKAITADEALGDRSVIHSLAHLADKACPPYMKWEDHVKEVRQKFHALQNKVPGLFPAECIKAEAVMKTIEPGGRITVKGIVQCSEVTSFGPAALTICDCDTDPECTISDLDEPCGYHQTIEANARALISTEKDFVHIVNRDKKREGRVQLMIRR